MNTGSYSEATASDRVKALRTDQPMAWDFGVDIAAQFLAQPGSDNAAAIASSSKEGVFDLAEQVEMTARKAFGTWLEDSHLDPPASVREALFDAAGLAAGATILDFFLEI
jgi:hypothetical protein